MSGYVTWYDGVREQTWRTPPEFFQRVEELVRS